MTFAADGAFGTSGVDWKLKAGEKVTVQASQAGKKLPGDGVFGVPIVVDAGKTIVALTFTPSLNVGLSEGVGDLQFGFSAGGSVAFRSGRVFDLGGGAGPTLLDALKSIFSTGIVPANVLDLAAMQDGDIGSVSGSGTLKLSATFDVAQVFNPGASLTLPIKKLGDVKLEAGASLEVGASVGLSGSYQIRVYKLPGGKVRLGYYKMSGSQFEFDVTASVGVSLTAGKTELLEKLMGMLGTPKTDPVSLVDAGLSDDQIQDLKDAVEASLSRSIAVSLAGNFAVDNSKSTMFEYEFDLGNLGNEGVSALNQALQGDLSALTSHASTDLPQGVRLLVSELDEVRKKTTTWKLNFLGLLNVLSVTELILSGKTLFNADTGELVVTDFASAKKILIVTRPLEAETKKLHKMLMQSLVITAAYRASGTQPLSGSLSGSMSYFDQVANAKKQTISDYLDNLVGVELITPADKAAFLAGSFSGRASVFLDASFTDADFTTMFFDGAGNERDAESYERMGRQAIAALIQKDDENDFRRQPMLVGNAASDKLWKEMSDAGQASMHLVLAAPFNSGPNLEILIHDYTVIKWWADSMTKAAKGVRKMKEFIESTGQSAEELQTDAAFIKARNELTKALGAVASDATPDFLDAWGVLAMDSAAGGNGKLSGILLTTGPLLSKHRG